MPQVIEQSLFLLYSRMREYEGGWEKGEILISKQFTRLGLWVQRGGICTLSNKNNEEKNHLTIDFDICTKTQEIDKFKIW